MKNGVGNILDKIIGKGTKGKKPKMAEVEMEVKPLSDEEAEEVMDDMNMERAEAARDVFEFFKLDELDDDQAIEFANALENLMSYSSPMMFDEEDED